jgi:putative hydrolase of the HAD superfamily
MPELRAVFFDLAGTLIAVRGGIGTQYSALARQFGVVVAPGSIDVEFARALRSAGRMVFPEARAAEVASLEKGFWKEVVRRVFLSARHGGSFGARFDDYFDRLFDHFATAAPWEVYPDVVPALEALRRRDLVVGLVTNFDRRVFALVEALGLAPYLDSITIPATAGAAKPERAIFEHALSTHGLHPDQAIQVGDSLTEDVEGARAAGLRAVLLDRKGRAGPGAVRTLAELPGLLT